MLLLPARFGRQGKSSRNGWEPRILLLLPQTYANTPSLWDVEFEEPDWSEIPSTQSFEFFHPTSKYYWLSSTTTPVQIREKKHYWVTSIQLATLTWSLFKSHSLTRCHWHYYSTGSRSNIKQWEEIASNLSCRKPSMHGGDKHPASAEHNNVSVVVLAKSQIGTRWGIIVKALILLSYSGRFEREFAFVGQPPPWNPLPDLTLRYGSARWMSSNGPLQTRYRLRIPPRNI